jgi:hypothetical protein
MGLILFRMMQKTAKVKYSKVGKNSQFHIIGKYTPNWVMSRGFDGGGSPWIVGLGRAGIGESAPG